MLPSESSKSLSCTPVPFLPLPLLLLKGPPLPVTLPLTGVTLAGVTLAGELLAGELLAGELLAGVLLAGVPLVGVPLVGDLLLGEGVRKPSFLEALSLLDFF